MKLIVVEPVAPTNPKTVSNELTNMAITKVLNKMTELSMMNLANGISSSSTTGSSIGGERVDSSPESETSDSDNVWGGVVVEGPREGVMGDGKRNLSRDARAG